MIQVTVSVASIDYLYFGNVEHDLSEMKNNVRVGDISFVILIIQ